MKWFHRFLTALLWLIPWAACLSQSRVSGTITNLKAEAVNFASVIAFKEGKVVNAVTADDNGKYQITIAAEAPFELLYKGLGYEEHKLVFQTACDSTVNVQLSPSQNKIKEVVILGKKPLIERKVDRYVFNIENSLAVSNTDAFEAVTMTPGVFSSNGSINIIGKGVTRVMLNDRLLTLAGDELRDFLKALPSNDIASIEVITTPPAKYDAEGNSGLINIKLKTVSLNSFSGSASGRLAQAAYTSGNGSTSLNMNQGKWTVSSSLSGNYGSIKPIEKLQFVTYETTRNDYAQRREYNKSVTARLAADYKLRPGRVLGVELLSTLSSPDKVQKRELHTWNINEQVISAQSSSLRNATDGAFLAANLHYNLALDTLGRKALVNLDYFGNTLTSNTFINSIRSDGGNNLPSYSTLSINTDRDINTYSAKVDVEYPVRFAALSWGAKAAYTTVKSYLGRASIGTEEPPISSVKDEFDYQENIQALYFNADKKISKQLQVQGGLRLERTDITGQSRQGRSTDLQYLKLFPSVHAAYKINDLQSWSFNYGRRISRPYYRLLNPFRWYDSPYSYESGNPHLLPTLSHNLELAYTHSESLIFSVDYLRSSNSMKEITTIDSEGLQATIPLNYYNVRTYGINITYIYNKLKWFESTNMINGYHYAILSNLEFTDSRLKQVGFYASSQNTIVLNNKMGMKLNVLFTYNSPYLDGVYKVQGFSNLNLALQTLILKKKVTARVGVSDIFRSQRNKYVANYNNVTLLSNNYYDRRAATVSLQYRFGNKKIRGTNNTGSNSAEIDRL
ncbi:outer membrane beta-barrel family protein [Hymenobacter sp.]|uniref:outer membrane beta-barrel family protein n=1 Tax=Hymenobacter sp. TaxID=1898978 RepID=UPI002EDA17BB